MIVNLTIQTPRLQLRRPSEFDTLLARAVELARLDAVGETDAIDVVAVTQDDITRLNRQFLGHDRTTDVIAFDLRTDDQTVTMPEDQDDEDAQARTIAEIVVCPDTALAASAEFGTSPAYEIVLYIVHGLLHIAGLDDLTERDAAEMRRREDEIMKAICSEHELDDVVGVEPDSCRKEK